METTLTHQTHALSAAKTALFTLACIAIFVAAAIFCGLLTFWIGNSTLRIVIREVALRVPVTIMALHYFAGKVIKTYNPDCIYGKLSFTKLLKWTAIAFILPVAIGVFFYLSHLMIPFAQSSPLSSADKVDLFIKWSAVSIAAGLTEEVLFRGHLFMVINSRYSKMQAIFISSLIFGIVHIAMLPVITPVDILIVVLGGCISGIMFSLIYQYTNAVWYAAIVHIVWDIFFIGKITAIAATQADANQTIMPFKLTTHNMLFTGGNFGIEAALPCFIVYLVVTGILHNRRKIA